MGFVVSHPSQSARRMGHPAPGGGEDGRKVRVIPGPKIFRAGPTGRRGGWGTLTQGFTLGYFHLLPNGRREDTACGVGFVVSQVRKSGPGAPAKRPDLRFLRFFPGAKIRRVGKRETDGWDLWPPRSQMRDLGHPILVVRPGPPAYPEKRLQPRSFCGK